MRVVDASVAAKWFLAEPDSDEALALLEEGHQLLAPSIIRVEVFGAISRRFREGHLPKLEAAEACAAWKAFLYDGHVRLLPTTELIDQAVRLSFDCRHPLPDCLYLAAAAHFDTELVTSDHGLKRRAAKASVTVTLLGKANLHG